MKKLAILSGMLIIAAGTVWYLNYSGQEKSSTNQEFDYSSNPHTKDTKSQIDELESNQWNKEQKDIYSGNSSANQEQNEKTNNPSDKKSTTPNESDDEGISDKQEDTAAKESNGSNDDYTALKLETRKALDDYKEDIDFDLKKYQYFNAIVSHVETMEELNELRVMLHQEGIIK
jgi:hypothetical protein